MAKILPVVDEDIHQDLLLSQSVAACLADYSTVSLSLARSRKLILRASHATLKFKNMFDSEN
jgi:hypothetical protein